MPLLCSRENDLLCFRGDQYSKEKEMGRHTFTEITQYLSVIWTYTIINHQASTGALLYPALCLHYPDKCVPSSGPILIQILYERQLWVTDLKSP